MWKAETRCIYDRKGLRYPTDMTDTEWALARPFVDVAQRGSGRQRRVNLREVLNAVFYVCCGAWIRRIGAMTPTPSVVRQCGRKSGVPVPACG